MLYKYNTPKLETEFFKMKKHENYTKKIIDIVYKEIDKLSDKQDLELSECHKLIKYYNLLNNDENDKELDLSTLTDEELSLLEQKLLKEEK